MSKVSNTLKRLLFIYWGREWLYSPPEGGSWLLGGENVLVFSLTLYSPKSSSRDPTQLKACGFLSQKTA